MRDNEDKTRPADAGPVEHPVRPCPFCGGSDVGVYEGDTFRWRLARCNGCGAQAGDVRIQTAGSGTRAEWEARAVAGAMAEWNKRAPNAGPNVRHERTPAARAKGER